MISGVHHIAMKCGTEEEIERVRNFYIDTLGMKVRREWPYGVLLRSVRRRGRILL